MSVELISVLVAVLAIGASLDRGDPDQQSRVADRICGRHMKTGRIAAAGRHEALENRWLREDMNARGNRRLREDIGRSCESRLDDRGSTRLEARLRDVTSSSTRGARGDGWSMAQAKLEGLLEGLREAISGRVKCQLGR